MRWEATDLKQRLLSFVPSKTRKAVTIPLRSELQKQLLKSPGVGTAFLFPSLAGRGTGGKSGLSGQFAKIGVGAEATRLIVEGMLSEALRWKSFAAGNNLKEKEIYYKGRAEALDELRRFTKALVQ